MVELETSLHNIKVSRQVAHAIYEIEKIATENEPTKETMNAIKELAVMARKGIIPVEALCPTCRYGFNNLEGCRGCDGFNHYHPQNF